MAAAFIYCITNLINQKMYVGKTYISVEARYKMHLKEYKKLQVAKRPLYAAMRKYGIENFKVEVLEVVTTGNLEEREMYWIKKLDTYHNGYNATVGGEGTILYESECFAEDFKNGMLAKDIATKYQCDRDTVTRHLKAMGINTRTNSTTKRSRQVAQYTLNGTYLRTHESKSAAARYLIEEGVSGSEKMLNNHIVEATKGKRKSAGGYKWKDVD